MIESHDRIRIFPFCLARPVRSEPYSIFANSIGGSWLLYNISKYELAEGASGAGEPARTRARILLPRASQDRLRERADVRRTSQDRLGERVQAVERASRTLQGRSWLDFDRS